MPLPIFKLIYYHIAYHILKYNSTQNGLVVGFVVVFDYPTVNSFCVRKVNSFYKPIDIEFYY